MNRVFTLLVVLLAFVLSIAQNNNEQYGYNKVLFLYEIQVMDSVILVENTNSSTAICIEKKNISYFVDKDSSFYSCWEVQPAAFKFLDPSWSPFIFHYVIPSVSDSNVVTQLKNQYFENRLCKIGYNDLWDDSRLRPIPYHNLTYSHIKCNHYLVLLMPYKFYDEHIDDFCAVDYATPFGEKPNPAHLLTTPFAEGLYIKLLFPLFYYQDLSNKAISE